MTINELYKWAVKNGYEDKELLFSYLDEDYYEVQIEEMGDPEYNEEIDAVIV